MMPVLIGADLCLVFRCKPDPGPQPPCDPVLEGVVSNPENCGRITDTNGAFRLGLTKLYFLLINNVESFHLKLISWVYNKYACSIIHIVSNTRKTFEKL